MFLFTLQHNSIKQTTAMAIREAWQMLQVVSAILWYFVIFAFFYYCIKNQNLIFPYSRDLDMTDFITIWYLSQISFGYDRFHNYLILITNFICHRKQFPFPSVSLVCILFIFIFLLWDTKDYHIYFLMDCYKLYLNFLKISLCNLCNLKIKFDFFAFRFNERKERPTSSRHF